MNNPYQEKHSQKADKIISNITEVATEKDVIHNNPYEEHLPYESIKWENGAWSVKRWKQVPPLPIDE